jgi:transcriptional regulator with XRE-family HTH domain
LFVDPERVREARLEAGLSLAQVAGDDVSRTFIHFVERGVSRPSRKILALIARRTGKPISYFLAQPPGNAQPNANLAADLTRVADGAKRFATVNRLTAVEREAMKLVELTLRQAAELTKAVQASAKKEAQRS